MNKLIWLGPAGLLLLSIAPLPYGYYIMLRFVVCGAATYLAWKHYEVIAVHPWTIVFVGVALLFNPFIKVHFSREIWAFCDISVAILFTVNMIKNQKLLSE